MVLRDDRSRTSSPIISFQISYERCCKELFSAERPFKDAPKSSIISRIRQGPLPEQPIHMNGEWWAVCTSCWGLDPASRPVMSVLVEKIEKVRISRG